MAWNPIVGQGLRTLEASRSPSDTPHSIWLLYTSDQPDTQHLQQTDTHVPAGIRNRNPIKREPADPRLRPRGHWDRQERENNLLLSILIIN